MSMIDEQPYSADSPDLRVYWGDETDEFDDRSESHRDEDDHHDRAEIEAYWAGRNHAGRKSARIAA